MHKQKTTSHLTRAGGAERTRRQAARPTIYTQRPRAPGSGPAPRRHAPLRHSRGEEGAVHRGKHRLNHCARHGEGAEVMPPSSEYLAIVSIHITRGLRKVFPGSTLKQFP